MNSYLALTEKSWQAAQYTTTCCHQHWLQFTCLHNSPSSFSWVQPMPWTTKLCRATSQEIDHQPWPWASLFQQPYPNTRKLQKNIKPNSFLCSISMNTWGRSWSSGSSPKQCNGILKWAQLSAAARNLAGKKPQEKIRHNKVKYQYYSIAVKLPKQVFPQNIEQIIIGGNHCSLHYQIELHSRKIPIYQEQELQMDCSKLSESDLKQLRKFNTDKSTHMRKLFS